MNIDLFDDELPYSVLPYDGESVYYGCVFSPVQASHYLRVFLADIPWQHDEAMMFGKHIVTARKVAWYGDARYEYTYSGRTRTARPWTRELQEIKSEIERLGGSTYNSCLLNLYADGNQGMGWHHDDERGLGKDSDIASVSFGATRRFDFRHKQNKEKISLPLPSGSLLIMRGRTQSYWQHQVQKSKKVLEPRVNLTFRRMLVAETRIACDDESESIR